jgi:fucose 4-O-acetylase-like acetyltransferase
MDKISYTLNVNVDLAVIGCYSLSIMCCHDNIFSSLLLQIRIGSTGRKTSRKTHLAVFVLFPVSQPVEQRVITVTGLLMYRARKFP